METRKRTRKAFPYNRKILEIYQKSKCRDLSIDITPFDKVLLEKARALSDKEVANILECHSDDTDASKVSHKPLSSQVESRLRKKENGMVLLPRSFYNEHPAKKVLDNLRTTRSKSSTHEKKNTPSRKKEATPVKSVHKNGTPAQNNKTVRSRNNSSTVQKENEPLGRKQRENRPNQLKAGKPSFSKTPKTKPTRQKTKPNGLKGGHNNDKEYHLVFIDPININGKKPNTDVKMMSLSDLLNTDKLPSKLWEVERVPPILFKTKSDITYNTIAAELDALMADNNHSNSSEHIMEVDTDEDEVMKIKSNGDDNVMKDKKAPEEIISNMPDIDQNNTIEKIITDSMEENNIDLTKEETLEDPIESTKENTKEPLEDEKESADVEEIKLIENCKMDTTKEDKIDAVEEERMDIVKEEKMDIVEEDISKDDKKDLVDVDENEAPEENIQDKMEDQDNETKKTLEEDTTKIEKIESEIAPDDKKEETASEVINDASDEKEKESYTSESTENPNPILKGANEEIDEETEKVQEEFPSIMDLLNEEPLSEQDSQKELGNESSNNIEISSEEKPEDENVETVKDVLSDNSEIKPTDDCFHEIPDQPQTQDIEISTEDNMVDVANNNEDKNIKLDVPKITTKKSDETIRSVVFRRFSADKQTYDRLVIFQSDLEYTVKLNNREVELLGAPKYMTSTEDLQILLQIVDEVSLDSFNVICKS